MNEAEVTRRSVPLKAAFEAARFDERTPDEEGFTAVFDREIRPRLVGRVEENVRIGLAVKRSRMIARLVVIPLAPVALALIVQPAVLLSNLPDRGSPDVFALGALSLFGGALGVLLLGVLFFIIIQSRRRAQEDPNHRFVVTKILEHLGCRLHEGKGTASPRLPRSPIEPWNDGRLYFSPHGIVGTFEGRIRFNAWRTWAEYKDGDKTRTSFRGWYLRVDLPFSFAATTFVRAPGAQIAPLPPGFGLERVRLESLEFEKAYEVSSTDQGEARVILTPDVIQHLTEHAGEFRGKGRLMLIFSGEAAHVWMPSERTELSDWKPFDPARLIEDLHESFAELSGIRLLLREIDVIADFQGFRAQAARNSR